jgi:hypothetical protein
MRSSEHTKNHDYTFPVFDLIEYFIFPEQAQDIQRTPAHTLLLLAYYLFTNFLLWMFVQWSVFWVAGMVGEEWDWVSIYFAYIKGDLTGDWRQGEGINRFRKKGEHHNDLDNFLCQFDNCLPSPATGLFPSIVVQLGYLS